MTLRPTAVLHVLGSERRRGVNDKVIPSIECVYELYQQSSDKRLRTLNRSDSKLSYDFPLSL